LKRFVWQNTGIIMGAASIGGIIGHYFSWWVFDTLGSYHLYGLFLWVQRSIIMVDIEDQAYHENRWVDLRLLGLKG